MGMMLEQVEVNFTSRELQWLWEQAKQNGDTLHGFIRSRALNLDSLIPGQEPFVRFRFGRESSGHVQCSCGVCCLD